MQLLRNSQTDGKPFDAGTFEMSCDCSHQSHTTHSIKTGTARRMTLCHTAAVFLGRWSGLRLSHLCVSSSFQAVCYLPSFLPSLPLSSPRFVAMAFLFPSSTPVFFSNNMADPSHQFLVFLLPQKLRSSFRFGILLSRILTICPAHLNGALSLPITCVNLH